MRTIEAGTYTDLTTCFSERPKWMQHAAARLLSDESITLEVLKEIAKIAIDEALNELPAPKKSLELKILGVVDGAIKKATTEANCSSRVMTLDEYLTSINFNAA
jgi:hypothetical protein